MAAKFCVRELYVGFAKNMTPKIRGSLRGTPCPIRNSVMPLSQVSASVYYSPITFICLAFVLLDDSGR